LGDNGTNLLDAVSPVTLNAGALAPGSGEIESGPRVGVSAAADRPWRFWVTDSPSVSAYRRSPRATERGPTRG
ncbi:MAG: DNA-3-methyladenine glycosylase, partial [Rhodococcus sp. (in: high G+C Gram-positive bacteria)]